ncbi:unnamed protein product [Lathyrus sativus]|nr:unnamed protein product [Lathyrus sativus]
MQAVKDKLHDMNFMRKAKAEAKAEEKAEKEIVQARKDIAHEVRLAKEAEVAMDLHVTKAGEIAKKEIEKHAPIDPNANSVDQGSSMQPPSNNPTSM